MRTILATLLKVISAGCITLVALVGLFYFGVVRGCTTTSPHPLPPDGAKDIHFEEWTAWQSWRYAYRFDASPAVCEAFAVSLMQQQSLRQKGEPIKASSFTKVPIRDRQLPEWFDVASVTDGTLLTCDDPICGYAVVDRARGRLYYYRGN